MTTPESARYVDGWPREREFGLVALDTEPIGAAWWRFFATDDPGYGFVATTIPELSVGVVASARGLGVGSALLGGLIAAAKDCELPGLSLSVHPENRVVHLYEHHGFRIVESSPTSLKMVLPLEP